MADTDSVSVSLSPEAADPQIHASMYKSPLPSTSKAIQEGLLTKSPSNADANDPDRSTGMHSWRKRYFVLLPGAPQVLQYFTDETKAELKGEILLFPGTVIKKHSSSKFAFVLGVHVPALNVCKEKIIARTYWLVCNSEVDQDTWYRALSRAAPWTVANGRILQVSSQFLSSSLTPMDFNIEISEGGGCLFLQTVVDPSSPVAITVERIPLFGCSAHHAGEPSQAWVPATCPKKVKPTVWVGAAGQVSCDVMTQTRFVVVPPSGEPIQLVAHCETHAKLLCQIINASDLSDPMNAILRVMDLLAFMVSDELGSVDHVESNMNVLMPAFCDWFLYTIERRVEAALAICVRRKDAPSLCDFIKALSRHKVIFRDTAFGIFVIDVIDVLLRYACNEQIDPQYSGPIADHLETVILPSICFLLGDIAEKPAFVRGSLQDNNRDWHADNLFDGSDIVQSMKTSMERDDKAAQVVRYYPFPNPVPQYRGDRQALLGQTGYSNILTAHYLQDEPRILLRLCYLLVLMSYNDRSCQWFYRQTAATTAFATALTKLATYSAEEDPFLFRNDTLMKMRGSITLKNLAPLVPTMLVVLDNIAAYSYLEDHRLSQADLELWTNVIWPAVSVTLLATVTNAPGALVLQFATNAALMALPKTSNSYLLSNNDALRRGVCTFLQKYRRRGSALFFSTLGNEFVNEADIFTLAYDHLYHVIYRLSAFHVPLRTAAIADLIAIGDDILTRVGKENSNKSRVSDLEFISAARFGDLFKVFRISDVFLWDQAELEGIGMKRGHAKKLLAMAPMFK